MTFHGLFIDTTATDTVSSCVVAISIFIFDSIIPRALDIRCPSILLSQLAPISLCARSTD